MLLIGLTGVARSGKDTAASVIEQGFGFGGYSLADPIRLGLEAMLGVPFNSLTSDAPNREKVLEPFGKSPRQMLQTLGTEWGRELVHEDIWLMAADRHIAASSARGVVIRDIRFDNEAEWLANKGGILIKIDRPDATSINEHKSEAGVSMRHIDFTIHNDSTLPVFKMRVESTVSKIITALGQRGQAA